MEKVVSERVISQKIVSKKNSIPIIGGILNKFDNLSQGIAGLCAAPVLILAALGVLVYSENFSKASETVGELELVEATEVDEDAGTSKISGEPNITEFALAPEVGEVLYYTYVKEEYREVEEVRTGTRTKVVNGQEIEETYEETVLVEKWEIDEEDIGWAEFSLGDIEIDPDNADLEFDDEENIYLLSVLEGYIDYPSSYDAQIGDVRLTVNYVAADEELIVVGDVSNGRVASGETFIISNKTEAELQQDLETSENTRYTVTKVIAFVLFFIGFMSIFGPIIALADFIPLAGKPANAAASVVSLVLSAISVLVVSLFIKFWWVLLIACVLLIVVLIGVLASVVVSKKVTKEAEVMEEKEKIEESAK